jgi:hypothetical protein
VDGVPLGAVVRTKKVYAVDLPDGVAADVALHLHESTGIVAVWVVPRLEEVPAVLRPPLPDAGAEP